MGGGDLSIAVGISCTPGALKAASLVSSMWDFRGYGRTKGNGEKSKGRCLGFSR